jgi:adenylate cyclase
VSAILKITEPESLPREINLHPGMEYSLGRAKDNDVVLNDRRVSRKHARIISEDGGFMVIDGYMDAGEIKRSVNHVYVNGTAHLEKVLRQGDLILIGETTLEFKTIEAIMPIDITAELFPPIDEVPDTFSPDAEVPTKDVKFDDNPLGHTQVQITANEIIGRRSNLSIETDFATPDEVKDLRRKARMLELLYEMSKTLGTVFDLKDIFEKATDLIFRGTPADRVVALLADETQDGKILSDSLQPIGVRTRDETIERLTGKMTISRTITSKVMEDKVAILSQDAKTDEMFSGAESIVSQGVRSTICAPLITESNVHGVVYADRLDPFAAFTSDHLELISAVAAQTALTVETVKSHKRLAREEVARANYSRFMPEYVVQQLLENPDSFRLGGVNQTITVLFADIRGFTAFSEKANPEKIVGLLNRYFTAMTEIIFEHGGSLDKYVGDELMALFGAPSATPEDAANAVRAAVAMQQRLGPLNDELAADGYARIKIGIGMHTGEATVGYIGSERRSEYTAIGDTVNLASRLESNAAGGKILISEATARAAGGLFPLKIREPMAVKGRLQPVNLFEVEWN